jgi:hypothetical protein
MRFKFIIRPGLRSLAFKKGACGAWLFKKGAGGKKDFHLLLFNFKSSRLAKPPTSL